MNFLTIGFGGMGCRHTQSILDAGLSKRVFVVEPNQELFDANLVRIGYSKNEVIKCEALDLLNENIEFAIVATSAEPRFDITRNLINHGVKNILLEKVVFQSKKQFEEIEILAKENLVKIKGNLPNRYFKNYIELKKYISKLKSPTVNMHVIGGNFGLACNSIHYVDLYTYLAESSLENSSTNLTPSNLSNRRGSQYKELNGILKFIDVNNKGSLTLVSNASFTGGVVITIEVNENTFYFYENEQLEYQSTALVKEFLPIPSSKLTSTIINDWLQNKSLLPDLTEMKKNHILLFTEFNKAFGLENRPQTICPIT